VTEGGDDDCARAFLEGVCRSALDFFAQSNLLASFFVLLKLA